MPLNTIFDSFSKTYLPESAAKKFKYTTTVRHKGTLISFAMNAERRIFYSVLNLSDNPADNVNTAPASVFDNEGWSKSPLELYFPTEITEVGFGVAGNTLLPVFRNEKPGTAEAEGTILPSPNSPTFGQFNAFKSTTARLSADAPFQVLSDGQYIYLFRQAIDENHSDQVKVGTGKNIPLVNTTLLVDRFILSSTTLMPKMEVRFQRSRIKNRPANRKDSLGAKDLDGNFFYEPTQELKFVRNLKAGRFSVLLLPTAVSGLQRWQIFAENNLTGRMDSINVERSSDGLFNTQGSLNIGAPDKGYAANALQFSTTDAHFSIDKGPVLGGDFTLEAWIKPDERKGDTNPLALISSEGSPAASRQNPKAAPSIWIEAQTRLLIGFGDGLKTWFEFRSKPLLTPKTWNHLAVSFDGSALCIYINGRLREKTESAPVWVDNVLQSAPDGNNTPQPIPERFSQKIAKNQTIARNATSRVGHSEHSFFGLIDEIRVWQRSRRQSELFTEKNHRLSGLEPDLAAYWHFDERDGENVLNAAGKDGTGSFLVSKLNRVSSDAPVGEHPGINRRSFTLPLRSFTSGPATLLYNQQVEGNSGYAGTQKPLKQAYRVMFVASTIGLDNKKQLAALDFAVSASGHLAQIPDAINLQTASVNSASNASLNENLDRIASLQEEFAVLDEDVNRLAPLVSKLENALAQTPSANPNIQNDIKDSALAGLNKQLLAWKNALIDFAKAKPEADKLNSAFDNAGVDLFRDVSFETQILFLKPSPEVVDLMALGLEEELSSIKINGPLEVVLINNAGVAFPPFIESTPSIGNLFNDKAFKVKVSERADHAAARLTANTALANAEKALENARKALGNSATALRTELNTKTTSRDQVVGPDLNSKKSVVNSGASALMDFVSIDQLGLSVSGSLLDFAWTKENSAPLLYDSATGSIALYFQGENDQFFVAYYDTRTKPAEYKLVAENGAFQLTCIATSTDADMDKISIDITDTPNDPDTCKLVISGPRQITETWEKVPRTPKEFANVLNGAGEERSFIGTAALSDNATLLQFQAGSKGIKRALAAGATIAAGNTRLVVKTAVSVGAMEIAVQKSRTTEKTSTELLPIFFIGYDYINNSKTTNLSADLYNGSLLLTALPEPSALAQKIKNQSVKNGVSLSSQWTAEVPGATLHFDGKDQHGFLADPTKLKAFSPVGDMTLETWVRPSRLEGVARLVQHKSDAAAYYLGLEKQALKSAFSFAGLVGSTIDAVTVNNTQGIAAGNTPHTIEAWIQMDALPADRAWPLLFGASGTGAHHWLIGKSGELQIGSMNTAGQHNPKLPLSQWVHIASVFDGTSLRVFINGVQEGAPKAASFNLSKGANPGIPLVLAQPGFAHENPFVGQIDDVRLWAKARTEAEIVADMNRRLGGQETGLVGYWHFESKNASDRTRFRQDAVVVGATATADSPISGYKVVAGVKDKAIRSTSVLPAGNWNHLAMAYDQAYGLEFNGSDNSLNCGKDVSTELSQDLTIEVFCHIKDLNRNQLLVQKCLSDDFAIGDNPQQRPYILWLSADNKLGFAFENVNQEFICCFSENPIVSAAGFNKIAVTRFLKSTADESKKSEGIVKTSESYEITLYLNGVAVNSRLFRGETTESIGAVVSYNSLQPETDNLRKPVAIGNAKGNLMVGMAPAAALVYPVLNTTIVVSLFNTNKFQLPGSGGSPAMTGFSGTISEIRLWSLARDRKAAADGKTFTTDGSTLGKAINSDEKGLISWWRFQEGGGTRAFDAKSQNHALIAGAKWVNSPDPTGSKLTLYLNGKEQATEASTLPNPNAETAQFSVGALRKPDNTFADHFQGELDEMRIWKTTRTREQIQDSLFRSLVERKNAGSTDTFVEEQDNLLAYFTFDAQAANAGKISDRSLIGNHLALAENNATYLYSSAPISTDSPIVRSALAGMKNNFNGLIGSSPAVQEYADMQTDNSGNLIGVLKRCYGFITTEGNWQLITGYKVGDMASEWIGQVQFAPELIGFIEGAPPVPSENLTSKSVDNIGDLDDYNEASFVELTEAEEVTYTYSASRDKGFDMNIDFNLGLVIGNKSLVGLGLLTEALDTENVIGVKAKFELAQAWLEDASSSVGRTKGQSTSVELRGRFSLPDENQSNDFGKRFIPDNVGQALVRSETADVFALRLLRNGALISYQMKPNPDIPKDWNIISFPINPAYTKQGTLDGKIGLKPDVDYPNALTYSPDTSYFKPIEAYALKNKINRDETELKVYYEQYAAEQMGFGGNFPAKLPRLHKRNLVNTYVWTADGGLFAETLETMDSQMESVGGSYAFKGMAGPYADITFKGFGVGLKFGLEALFGGHYNVTVNKSAESKSTFGLNINVDKVERDIYKRQTNANGEEQIIFDSTDPKRRKPVKWPGKVDAYRFMSFYLEPDSEHHEQFYNKIIDPIWLEQSDDPGAIALRAARQPGKKPPCWRVMHRVTYVSRILPPLDLSAPSSIEKTLQTLEIDSNFELIKMLEPYVGDKLSDFAAFSSAVDDTLNRLLPELLPHAPEVKQFLGNYFGALDTENFGGLPERSPNQAPIVNAGADQLHVGLDGDQVEVQLDATIIDDRIAKVEDLFVQWKQSNLKPGETSSIVFENAFAAKTKAVFKSRGTYELQVTASDGTLEAADSLTIIVNVAPKISAGNKLEISGLSTKLNGSMVDNGLGFGDPLKTDDVVISWTVKSGIGDVTFEHADTLTPTVTFPTRGHYLLQLSVFNGTFTTTREVQVAVATRVTNGIQALYVFDENQGQVVNDVSGTGTALNLQIPDLNKAIWGNKLLKLNKATVLSTANPATRLISAIKTSGELSLEAWIVPGQSNATGFNRILSISNGPATRNVTLGQTGNRFQFQLKTSSTDANASNKALAGGVAVRGTLTHLVVTRDENGFVQMYQDGKAIASRMVGDSLNNWSNDFKLLLGNEFGDEAPGRAWLGEFHLVAIYSKALKAEEVAQNFSFKANENLPPVVSAGEERNLVVKWSDYNWAAPVSNARTLALGGRVTHDRGEASGGIKWEQVGGPTKNVQIKDAKKAAAEVTLNQKGQYIFRLSADDGEMTISDEAQILVHCQPNVSTVKPQHLALIGPFGSSVETNLLAEVLDSGLGNGSNDVTYTWSWPASTPGSAGNVIIATPTEKQTKVTFKQRGLFVLRLEVNNGVISSIQDVNVTVNQLPVLNSIVSDPASKIITLPVKTLKFNAVLQDSGLGNPGADALNFAWAIISGPLNGSEKTKDDGTRQDTEITFSKGGLYILQLTVTNPKNPELKSVGSIQVTVNEKPLVDLSPVPSPLLLLPKSTGEPLGIAINLDATVSDDGLPENPGVVSLKWSATGTVGGVIIEPDNTDFVEARFTKKGKYTLQLKASDGAAETVQEAVVVVNTPPSVKAGNTTRVTAVNENTVLPVNGTLNDSGLGEEPVPLPVSFFWDKVSGPGDVAFSARDAQKTLLTLPKTKGIYTLRLTADNGFASAFGDMKLVVNEKATLTVAAGPVSNFPRRRRLVVQVIADGLGDPANDRILAIWAKTSGPAGVTFDLVQNKPMEMTAIFVNPGNYTLECTIENGSDFSFKETLSVTIA